MIRNKTASQHNFAVIPQTDVPRSRFRMRQTRKQAFNASELVPVMCEEVLPGDTWQHTESIMARLATPIAPVVDDLDLETWYFFVPNRITWQGTAPITKWEDFITGNDAGLTLPTMRAVIPTVSYELLPNSVLDHFGLLPQVYAAADSFNFNVLPIWAYFTIYNEWFRDENLQVGWSWSPSWTSGVSSDIVQGATTWDQMPLRVNKRSDYFTRSLPWPQKGAAVTIPLGTSAPVYTTGVTSDALLPWTPNSANAKQINTAGAIGVLTADTGTFGNMFADLSTATAATINSLRPAMATQQLLEKDARGGTRYVESLLVHFGVRSPDYRLQRPEYLGGSKLPVTVNPIAQTAAYDAEPGLDPSAIGNLGAEMHASGHKRTFTYAATEHGYIIGLCAVRATPTYQQGTRRHWRRQTRLDFAWPTLANLGEQAVNAMEIYQTTTGVASQPTWGYQERNAEYRYTPNEITGVLRSTAAQPLDWWHYAEEFGSEPLLNSSFITDKTKETLARSLATAPSEQWSAQIIMDIMHDNVVARLMPAYAVPGLNKF